MPLTLTIVTAEQTVLERNDVQRLIVPTMDGQITILPKHAALMAALESGEMIAHTPEGEVDMVVHSSDCGAALPSGLPASFSPRAGAARGGQPYRARLSGLD